MSGQYHIKLQCNILTENLFLDQIIFANKKKLGNDYVDSLRRRWFYSVENVKSSCP